MLYCQSSDSAQGFSLHADVSKHVLQDISHSTCNHIQHKNESHCSAPKESFPSLLTAFSFWPSNKMLSTEINHILLSAILLICGTIVPPHSYAALQSCACTWTFTYCLFCHYISAQHCSEAGWQFRKCCAGSCPYRQQVSITLPRPWHFQDRPQPL